MSQTNFLKKGNSSTNSNPNLVYPVYHKIPRDENSLKNINNLNIPAMNKPPISSREFGRELIHPNSNHNLNGTNERKSSNNPNKLLNYFRPLRKEKEEKKSIKQDTSLYNLRPRITYSLNNSKNNSNNNSFNYNNENVNTINSEMCISKEKKKVSNRLEKSNGMDVEMIIEKENYNSTKNVCHTAMNLDFSYKQTCLKQNITHNNYIDENFQYADPQLALEYIDEIYDHLKSTEFDFLPRYGYMKDQRDINEKMRAILIDWLVDVHLKFKLLPETLFLTTQIIDRFLDKKEINRNRLQLVGVSALFLACKYEEIYPPELKDFVYITDKAYSKADILSMEYEILNELQFSITHPSSLRFLEVFIQLSQMKFEEHIYLFARYLLELYLIEYRMIKYPPSWIAAATLYITIRVKKLSTYHKKIDIPKISGYSEEKLKECARDICIILDNAEKSSLQAVKNKYSSTKFMEVAKWKKN